MRKRTTIWLDDADREAIAMIRQRYGVASDSDAIRLAVRLVAQSTHVDLRRDGTGREPEKDASPEKDA